VTGSNGIDEHVQRHRETALAGNFTGSQYNAIIVGYKTGDNPFISRNWVLP